MNVSIIIPVFNPDKVILKKILKTLKNQDFNDKIEIMTINKGLGLAASLNYGIKRARYPIVMSLHQDCIPSDNSWLTKLISPLKDKRFIASVSKVRLERSFWESFDIFARALTIKEVGEITPAMDEKGCAYRKKSLEQVGYFDETNYRTGGEDLDMYLKLKTVGDIAYPNASVNHMHYTTLNKRLKKISQNANSYGVLIRLGKISFKDGWKGIILSLPLIGLGGIFLNYRFGVANYLIFPYILISPFYHFFYLYGFWKGFLIGKQTI